MSAVRTVFLCLVGGVLFSGTGACSRTQRSVEVGSEPVAPPVSARPVQTAPADAALPAAVPADAIDLTDPATFVTRTSPAGRADTTQVAQADARYVPHTLVPQRIRDHVPPHERPGPLPAGTPNDLPLGATLEELRARPGELWPGIGQTGWIPPDPALAVGPHHIVTTVNQSLAFYTKDGTQQFYATLTSFFSSVGAGDFVFDPKCFYDHYAGRFVVVAPEVYGNSEAWITIGVSDDDDPHGTWYQYRTNAVVQVGATTFWWDYPGVGYDYQAYYVTSNLFGLNQGGWGGVGYRVFLKEALLSGEPATYHTLRDGSSASVQVAQHFGWPQAPFFVSVASGSTIRIQALRNPTTNPTLVTRNVAVPPFSGPFDAPTAGGGAIWLIDARIMNVHWRDGNLYAAHHVSDGSRNFARWYHFQTNDWPNSGGPTLAQSGNVDGGPDVHTWFPAIYSNADHEVALVLSSSSPTQRVAVNATGRLPSDPPGTMGALTLLKLGTVNTTGRWGDYYDVAIDPVDDTRFWVIGEYPESWGWSNWISSFSVAGDEAPLAIIDDAGAMLGGESRTLDVLDNDVHPGGLAFDLSSFDAVSLHGGGVELSKGTGPGGRDELRYAAPAGYVGPDRFGYTIQDTAGRTSSTIVTAEVFDPGDFRDPENPPNTEPGAEAAYYALSAPSALPNFDLLTPYATEIVPLVSFGSTAGNFAGSGRADDVGAVFEGYVTVPQTALYTLFTHSDDGSRLYVGDTLVVENDGLHGLQERSGVIGLKAGAHAVRVEFFERGGQAGLIVRIEGGGLSKQVIPGEMWSHVVCRADFDGDGQVGFADLTLLLAAFGHNDGGDVDGDGDTDFEDLAGLLGEYGLTCD